MGCTYTGSTRFGAASLVPVWTKIEAWQAYGPLIL